MCVFVCAREWVVYVDACMYMHVFMHGMDLYFNYVYSLVTNKWVIN